MHGYVVFDNNTYKGVSRERLDRIISAERTRSIVPLANLAILQELLARARDPDLKQRGRNRGGIRKLGHHCRSEAGETTIVNFLSPVESQVYQLLAGEQHASDAETFKNFGEMVGVVTEADNADPLTEISENLDAIEQIVRKVEAEYVSNLEVVAKLDAEPNQIKRNLNYAADIAARTQALYGRKFTPEEIVFRIIDMAKITSIGFALRDSVIEEVRRDGGHGQHKNTIWDEQVVSSTSMYTSIRGRTVLLVTEEPRLLDAAALADAADHVCNLTGYEKMLELPPWVPDDK